MLENLSHKRQTIISVFFYICVLLLVPKFIYADTYKMSCIDGSAISTTPESPKKLHVLIFGRPGCGNTRTTLKGISESSWVSAENIGFIYADVDGNSSETISAFAENYSSDIIFCYGNNNKTAWSLYGTSGKGTLPFVLYVNDQGKVIEKTTGCQYSDDIYDIILDILGPEAPEPDKSSIYTVQTLSANKSEEARSMLTMVNKFRSGKDAWYWNSDDKTKTICSDLEPLTYDYELEKAAIQRAKELTVFYSHTRPTGKSCFSAYPRNKYTSRGENIAYGQENAKEVFKDWQEDDENYLGQGHRRNMLYSGFNAAGFACFEVDGNKFWVQEFGYNSSFSESDLTPVNYSDKAKKYDIEVSENILTPDLLEYESKLDMEINKTKTIDLSICFESDYGIMIYLPTTVNVEDSSVISLKGYKIKALKAGKTTINLSAKTGPEKVFTAKTIVNVRPPKIKLKSVKNKKKKKIVVKWQRNANVNGYEIQYSRKKGFSGAKKKTVNRNKNTVTIKGFSKGKTYYIRVRSYVTTNNGKKLYGKWSSKKKIKIKK